MRHATHLLHAGAPLVGLGLAILTGCGSPYAHERNPSFPAGQMAAAPVVTYPVVHCGRRSNRTLDETLRLVLEQRGANKPSSASLASAPEIDMHLCGYVMSPPERQESVYGIPIGNKPDGWRVPLALGASVQKVSAANGAATNVFVVTEQLESCGTPTSTMTDAQGRTVARVQSSEVLCTPTPRFAVHSLVFSSRSELLWNGAEMVDTTQSTEMDQVLQALVGRIPAAFGGPEPAATTKLTSAEAPVEPPPPPAPVAAPEPPPPPPLPSDVPIATSANRKIGYRQSALKGNSKSGYALTMLEGDGGKGELHAQLPGKLVVGRPMPVTLSGECSGNGTLTLSTLPPMKKASATPKMLGTAAGAVAIQAQCPDGPMTIEGPMKAELTVQR